MLVEMAVPVLVIGGSVALSWPLAYYIKWAMDPDPVLADQRSDKNAMTRYQVLSSDPEQTWKDYCVSMLVFNVLMFVIVYGILLFQGFLPLNPDDKSGIEPALAFNTAASFTSNTNLQHYSGEVSMSYFSQLFGLMWLQFVSAATGIAAFVALARGLSGRKTMGNFYTDLRRSGFLVLLPLSFVVAFILVLCGSPMTLEGSVAATTLEGASQTIARGPVAAFVAIKQLGTNGGGYFGPNSTHPFENANFWSNIVINLSITVVPMAAVWLFGRITGKMRHAFVVFGVMFTLYLISVGTACYFESQPTPALTDLPVEQTGNLEGKELRFGPTAGPMWAVATTATSNGSVNAMHDSLNPLTGLIPMAGMWLNVTFGGVGVGFINMFLFIIVSIFISGMMVGRTPEYLSRKVEAKEMKLALIAMLAHPFFILGGVALFAATPWGQGTIQDQGSHGLSEIIYEFSSAAANNGSGFEGLGDNTLPWNIATGVIMLLARFIPIIAPLAIAGSLAFKRPMAETSGTFRVDTFLFGGVLLGTILIVGALLFLPLAVLGPIAEHLAD